MKEGLLRIELRLTATCHLYRAAVPGIVIGAALMLLCAGTGLDAQYLMLKHAPYNTEKSKPS